MADDDDAAAATAGADDGDEPESEPIIRKRKNQIPFKSEKVRKAIKHH